MKKSFLLFLLLAVSGCATMTDKSQDEASYYDDDEFAYDEVAYGEVAEPIDENSGLAVGTASEQSVWQESDRQMPQRSAQQQNQWQEQQQATISADGSYIEIPAQRVYLNQNQNGQVPANVAQPEQANRQTVPPMAYSKPGYAPATPMVQPVQTNQAQPMQMQQKAEYVTLQSPNRPNTYAQCPPANTACILYFEQQGYRHVPGIPQFAGYQDVPSASDYPGNGRWRNTNNTPRW